MSPIPTLPYARKGRAGKAHRGLFLLVLAIVSLWTHLVSMYLASKLTMDHASATAAHRAVVYNPIYINALDGARIMSQTCAGLVIIVSYPRRKCSYARIALGLGAINLSLSLLNV